MPIQRTSPSLPIPRRTQVEPPVATMKRKTEGAPASKPAGSTLSASPAENVVSAYAARHIDDVGIKSFLNIANLSVDQPNLPARIRFQYSGIQDLAEAWEHSSEAVYTNFLAASQEVSEAFGKAFQTHLDPRALALIWSWENSRPGVRGASGYQRLISSLEASLNLIEDYRIRQFSELWNEEALTDLMTLLDDRNVFCRLENPEAVVRQGTWLANGIRRQNFEVWERLDRRSTALWTSLNLSPKVLRREQLVKLRIALMQLLNLHKSLPARLEVYSERDQALIPLSGNQILEFMNGLGIARISSKTAQEEFQRSFPRLAILAREWGPYSAEPSLFIDAVEEVRREFQAFFAVDFDPRHLAGFVELERSLVNLLDTRIENQNYFELGSAVSGSLQAMEFFGLRLLPEFWSEANVGILLAVFRDQKAFALLSKQGSDRRKQALKDGEYQLNGVTPECQKALMALIKASHDWYEELKKSRGSRAQRVKHLKAKLCGLLIEHHQASYLDREDLGALRRAQPWILRPPRS